MAEYLSEVLGSYMNGSLFPTQGTQAISFRSRLQHELISLAHQSTVLGPGYCR